MSILCLTLAAFVTASFPVLHGQPMWTPPYTGGGHGMSLWIDEDQVKEYSGYPMTIHVIVDGVVMPYVMDFQKLFPVIPPEVKSVNFTWKSAETRTFRYDFDQLVSFDPDILSHPYVTGTNIHGRVPRRTKTFSVHLPCHRNSSGVGSFAFGLRIVNEGGSPLPGTPLRFRLQKMCHQDDDCPRGYVGSACTAAICYPDCMNGGICIKPGQCQCPDGFQGPHCEGGICQEKCLNGGKCIQKDTCSCRRGFYGQRCEYSKCSQPCSNGGRCVGDDRCRCRPKFTGQFCEIMDGPEDDGRRRRRKRRRRKRIKYV